MKRRINNIVWAFAGLLFVGLQFATFVHPAQAAALTSSTDIKEQTRQYSIYAAYHACATKAVKGKNLSSDLTQKNGLFTATVVAGFVAEPTDGQMDCAEAYNAWYQLVGFASINDAATAIGANLIQSCQSYGTAGQSSCNNVLGWNGTNVSTLLSAIDKATTSKSIPITEPAGGGYWLSYSALVGACGGGSLTNATGSGAGTVAILGDESGKIIYKSTVYSSTYTTSGPASSGQSTTINLATSSTSAAAWPRADNYGSEKTTCAGVVKQLNEAGGTAEISKVLVDQRVSGTANDFATQFCQQIKNDSASCVTAIQKITLDCINSYYDTAASANSGSALSAITRGDAFDPNTVGQCIFSKLPATRLQSLPSDATSIIAMLSKLQAQNTPIAAASDTEKTSDDPCAILPPDTQMRWLACTVLTVGSGIADAFYNIIQSLLYTPVDSIFGNDHFKSVVSTFRIMGIALIIIAGLVMVIAQATGTDFVDAYTVRKVLPKLGIALVGIALAFPLLKLAITITNDVAIMGGNLLAQLGASGTASSAKGLGDFLSIGITGAGAGAITVAIALVKLGAGGMLSMLATIVLALLIGVLVLALRQLVIVVLVLLAPLAIASYVLPGTEKLWKFWKNTLLTTLMMFPIIMLFLSAGKFLANVFGNMGGDSNVNAIMAVIVYFAPYLMLPFAFKLAGGFMSTIFQIANDKGKGAFDRLRNQRAKISEDRTKRADSSSLWDPNSKITKALRGNKVASWIADPKGNAAHFGMEHGNQFAMRAGNRVESKINSERTEQTGKLMEELNGKYLYNDKAFRLLSGSHGQFSKTTRARLKDAGLYNQQITSLPDLEKAIEILSHGSGTELVGANALEASKGRLATLYQDPEMTRANITGAGMIGLAAHGFASGKDLAGSGNLLAKSGMGNAAAHALITQAQLVGARSRPDLKAGYGVMVDKESGEFINGMSTKRTGGTQRQIQVLGSLTTQDLAGAKAGAFDALEKGMDARLEKGGNDRQAQLDQLMSWAGYYSSASQDIKIRALDKINRLGEKDPSILEKFKRLNASTPDGVLAAGAATPTPEPEKKPGGK